MIDEATFIVKAGNGGDGKISFRREKYVPKGGPDGGDGGNGGSVFLVADPNLNTLQFFAGKTKFQAEHGGHGGKNNRHGKNGQDLTLSVPVGTVVEEVSKPASGGNGNLFARNGLYSARLIRTHGLPGGAPGQSGSHTFVATSRAVHTLADLNEAGMRVVVAKGGKGGRGNAFFKSATNRTPREAERGEPGEVRQLTLELKVLANVGLVGLPNAGKSTLLSVLTRAKPKIANYPFTTLEPNLGVMVVDYGAEGAGASGQPRRRELVIADIPGLIEGAHAGKGLGIEFLKHIERCEVLVYVLYPKDEWLTLPGKELAKLMWEEYGEVKGEVQLYKADLVKLPSVVVVNKVDLLSEEWRRAIGEYFAERDLKMVMISAVTDQNLDQLIHLLVNKMGESGG